jgi:type II secretion system protein G
MKSSPLSATLVVMAAAGFFMSAEAAEKSYVERLREITALAKQQRTEADLDMFQYALWTYRVVSGRFPTEEQGLGALVEKPILAPVPARWQQLTKSLPPDAWKRPYRYVVRKRDGADEYVLISDGPDLAAKGDNLERVVPAKAPRLEKEGETMARRELRHLHGLLQAYQVACDRLPTEEQGLSALQTKPVLEPVPKIWIRLQKKEFEPDPWGRPYRYRVREQDGKEVHVLSSDGPDAEDKKDDIEVVVALKAVDVH